MYSIIITIVKDMHVFALIPIHSGTEDYLNIAFV